MSASDDPAERSIRVVKGIRHTPERNYGAACVDLQGVPWSIHERWMTFVRAPTATKFPAGVPARPVSLQRRPEANSWTGGTPSAISKHEETKMFGICLLGRIVPEMLPGSNTRRLLAPSPRAPVNVIIDPLLSGPKELKKVDSPVFAGLENAQQHQIITDATFS